MLDPDDPFGDPFADDNDTPMQERPRMHCECGIERSCIVLIMPQGRKFRLVVQSIFDWRSVIGVGIGIGIGTSI